MSKNCDKNGKEKNYSYISRFLRNFYKATRSLLFLCLGSLDIFVSKQDGATGGAYGCYPRFFAASDHKVGRRRVKETVAEFESAPRRSPSL